MNYIGLLNTDMIIKKNIEVGIDIHNPINVYTDNDNIRHILADRYENRCYKGCFILRINKILRIGECVINQDGSPSFGMIPVIMEVTAIVYVTGEVINGCVVQNKDAKGVIIASTEIASLILTSNKLLDSIVKGQIISVRVAAAKYTHGSPKVAVHAIPYLFTNRPYVYKLGPITEATKSLTESVRVRIAEEEKKINTIKKDKPMAWKTFDQLLYAYKEEQKAPPGATESNILEDKIPGLYISRDSRINLSQPLAYTYNDSKFPDGYITKFEVASDNVMLVILEDYCSQLRTVREMVDIYTTEELINSHRNIWQLFKKSKF